MRARLFKMTNNDEKLFELKDLPTAMRNKIMALINKMSREEYEHMGESWEGDSYTLEQWREISCE